MRPNPAHWLLLVLTMSCLAAPATADDFRIETKVFVGKSKRPVSRNTTLFRAGYVYDYMASGRVAVFDRSHGRFILLDPTRKMKAEVQTEEIQLLVDRLHEMAASDSSAALRFAADPDFEVEFDESGELTLAGSHVTYKLKTEPAATPEAAQQYREFADWYARFNTMTHRGSAPPFPRLAVNAELAKRGLVPSEVLRSDSARSEHMVSWRLLESDHRQIAETANQLATFKQVDFRELIAPAVTKR